MNIKYKSLGTHIKSANITESMEFYENLGFKPAFAYGSETFLSRFHKSLTTAPEKYNGVTFEVGTGKLEVADGHIAVKPEVFKQKVASSKVSAMIGVDSVEKLVKLARDHNINIAVPIRTFPWGTREVVIKDPDGFVLVFIESIST